MASDDDVKAEDADIAELQDEALRLRRQFERNMGGLKAKANRLTDWRHYVRKYPMAVLGLGVLAGYVLMPRRSRPPQYPPPVVIPASAVNGSAHSTRSRYERVPAPRSPIRIAAESLLQSALAFTAQRVMEGQWGHGAKARTVMTRGREDAS